MQSSSAKINLPISILKGSIKMEYGFPIKNGVLEVISNYSEEDFIDEFLENKSPLFIPILPALKSEAIDRLFFAMSFVMNSDEINFFKGTVLNEMGKFTNVSNDAKEVIRKILVNDIKGIIFLNALNLNLDELIKEFPKIPNYLQLFFEIKDKCSSLNISDVADLEEFKKNIENDIKLGDAIPGSIINEICYLLVFLMPPEIIIEIISGLFISENLYSPVKEYLKENKIISNENFHDLVYDIYTTLFVNLLAKGIQFEEIIESINFKLKAKEILEKIADADKEICKEIDNNKILKKLFHDFLKFFNNDFFNDREGEIVLNLLVKYNFRNLNELETSNDLQIILNHCIRYFRRESTNIESNAIPNLESDDLIKTSQEKC